jgi:hypothetical protein
MAAPVDEKLYNETKKKVDEIYDKPSAYRSMAYTRFYLRAFREKYGEKKDAYKGKRPGDLEKWRREKWVDIRSFLDTPKNPIPCGGVEYGKKEYPLCMPLSKAKRYDKQELSALLYRKSELGKTRLVKEPYLRDLYGKPLEEVKVKDIKPIEPPKIKKVKVEKSNIKTTVTKKEPTPKPEREQTKIEEKIDVEIKRRGRPRRERTAEEIAAQQARQERIISRRENAAARRQATEARRVERERRQTERAQAQPVLPPGLTEGSFMRTPTGGIISFV